MDEVRGNGPSRASGCAPAIDESPAASGRPEQIVRPAEGDAPCVPVEPPPDSSRDTCSAKELNLLAKRSLPRHGYLLPRTRLNRLLQVFPRGVVTVVAGPGYGKTAFVTDALRVSRPSAAPRIYLGLSEEDQDPRQFFCLLFAALEEVHPGVSTRAQERLTECRDPEGEAEHVMRVLLRQLSAFPESPVRLAIDDLHLVHGSPGMLKALELLLQDAPPQWLVVVCSRKRLPFSLSDLRLNGRLLEVGLRRLRLTPREVVSWAKDRWCLDLTLPEARALWRTTQGWPVALVLMGELLHQGNRLPLKDDITRLLKKGKGLNEYLATNVYETLDPLELDVIQASAPLPRVVFPRDDGYLPGAPGEAEALLEDLVDRGFLATEAGHRAYNLHPLMRAYAERRLALDDPREARALALRAAGHLEEAGELVDAAILYLRARDYDAASHVIRLVECADLNSSVSCLPEELHRLLPEEITEFPWLRVICARQAEKRGKFARAASDMESLATQFSQLGDSEGLVKCFLSAAFAYFASGNLSKALQLTEKAHRHAVDKRQRIECLVVLGNLHAELCEWDRAVELLETALAQVEGPDAPGIRVRVSVARSKIFYYRGSFNTAAKWARKSLEPGRAPRLVLANGLSVSCMTATLVGCYEEALNYAQLGLKLAEDYSLVFHKSCLLLNAADALIGSGDISAGIKTLRDAETLCIATTNASHLAWAWDLLGDLYRRTGNLTRLLSIRERALELLGGPELYPIDYLRVLGNMGLDLAVRDERSESTTTLEDVLGRAVQHELHSIAIPVRFYLGWLNAINGDESQALRYLTQATEPAFANHHIHFLLQEARCATPILALCSRYGLGTDIETLIIPRLPQKLQLYYQELSRGSLYPTDVPLGSPKLSRARLARRTPRSTVSQSSPEVRAKMDLLTEREMEILRLISLGLPNKKIGAQLFITEKTIKTHANHIYKKLGVTNRVQAGIVFRDYHATP